MSQESHDAELDAMIARNREKRRADGARNMRAWREKHRNVPREFFAFAAFADHRRSCQKRDAAACGTERCTCGLDEARDALIAAFDRVVVRR